VGFGNCTTSSGTGTSLTFAHTVSAVANSFLIVTFHGEGDSAGQVSGVTFNVGGSPVAMTLLQRYYSGSDPGPGLEIYYLALGTGENVSRNVVVSNLNSIPYLASACSFNGVDQISPTNTTVANRTDPLDSGSVAIPASGMGFEVALWGRNGDCVVPVAQAAGQTKRFDPCYAPSSSYLAFGSTRTTTGNFTWNGSNSAWTASVAIPINASSGGSPIVRRRVVGIQ
jgi:hypothetical protein